MNPLRLGLIVAAVATAIIACLSYARAEAVNFCTTPEFAWNASVSDDEFVILKKDHKCITAPVEAYPNRVVDRGYIDDKPIYIAELSVFYKDAWWGLYTALDNDPWYQPLTKARYDEEWENRPANVRRWFNNLMQPDNANVSCCGDADAYEADLFEQNGDSWVAIITGQGPLIPSKPYIKEGTRVPVPNHKMKWDEGNPTGHGIIFIGGSGQVLCYVTPGGV